MIGLSTVILTAAVGVWQVLLPFTPQQQLPTAQTGKYQAVIEPQSPPQVTVAAQAAYIEDFAARNVLYAKNADQARPIASLTKLMTAYIIIRDRQPDDIVTITEAVTSVQGGANASINLVPGDQILMRDLLAAALIPSANDAAVALAVWHSGSTDAFANEMNRTARELNLKTANFSNPSGLDPSDNRMSAQDLGLLTHYALGKPLIRQTVARATGGFTSVKGRPYAFTSTNQLLSQKGIVGVKTGFTEAAGQCLITLTERDGRELLSVVLGSPDRFNESRSMINWGTGLDYE